MQHNHLHLHCCKLLVNLAKKWLSGKQNKTLACPARQAMFWADSVQCNFALFNRMVGQVEVPAGQVNISCPTQQVMFWNLCCTLAWRMSKKPLLFIMHFIIYTLLESVVRPDIQLKLPISNEAELNVIQMAEGG